MAAPLVTVMMPAYNAGRSIGQAVESLRAQTYSNWQLVIVNDGSTDQTGAIAESFRDPRIEIVHQPNSGESSARNMAMRIACGEYLAFLDADDLYLPEHLLLCVEYLSGRPDIGGVYTDGFYIDGNLRRSGPLSSRRRGPFEGDIFEPMVRSSDVFGTPLCVMLRMREAARLGLEFDPTIVIGPDWAYLTRISETVRFGYIDRCTCLYRVHTDNISVRTDMNKRLESLARCREQSIKLERFSGCSLQTRLFVFYDLLVNLLEGNQVRQEQVTEWPEFLELPASDRARLLRLVAGRQLLSSSRAEAAGEWLRRSKKLNPHDRRTMILAALFRANPRLCKVLIELHSRRQHKSEAQFPFSGLAFTDFPTKSKL